MKQFLMTLLFFSSLAITQADAQSCCLPTPACCKPDPTCCSTQKSAKAGKSAAAATCSPEQMRNCSPEEVEACLSGGLLASASAPKANTTSTSGKKSTRRPVTKTVAARQH